MSPTDSSIIAVICKFPDMSHEEIKSLLDKIQDQSLRKVGMALVGWIDEEELTDQEREKFNDLQESNAEKTNRIRNEEIESRRKEVMTPLARNLLHLYQQGKISQNALLVYGVSGEIPVRHPRLNRDLTHEEKVERLRERMRQRFGDNWEQTVGDLPPGWVRHRKEWRVRAFDWSKDGF